jgi:hypothetical protein
MSYCLVQIQVKTHLHGEIIKAKGFQIAITNEDFGHDSNSKCLLELKIESMTLKWYSLIA